MKRNILKIQIQKVDQCHVKLKISKPLADSTEWRLKLCSPVFDESPTHGVLTMPDHEYPWNKDDAQNSNGLVFGFIPK